jgi:hypothetical protein
MEVGPGNRRDALLQAFADGIRNPLLDRGFAIGGAADNFCKALPMPTVGIAGQIAREILAIMLDVVGYDGKTDLAYRFEQCSVLEAAHLADGIGSSLLCRLLATWGFQASPLPEDFTVINVSSWEFDFRIQLLGEDPQRQGRYSEIQCSSIWAVPANEAASLVEKVNSRPYAMKAYLKTGGRQPTQAVRLSLGINLAGGVSLNHIRAEIVGYQRVMKRVLQFG